MSNNLPDDTDLKQETLDFMEEVEADLESTEEVKVERMEELGAAGLSVLLPLFYIYTWTAARSLFIKLGDQETLNSLQFDAALRIKTHLENPPPPFHDRGLSRVRRRKSRPREEQQWERGEKTPGPGWWPGVS